MGWAGNMMAGAVAGTAEHLVMYPVDSVKVGQKQLYNSHRGIVIWVQFFTSRRQFLSTQMTI